MVRRIQVLGTARLQLPHADFLGTAGCNTQDLSPLCNYLSIPYRKMGGIPFCTVLYEL